MSVEHAPENVASLESTQRRNRGLTIAVAVLTVITLGLAGWLAYLLLVPEENSVSADVAQVAEEYSDAWNNYDGAAFLGLVTADYQFFETAGQPGEDAEGTAAMISNDLEGFDWAVEQHPRFAWPQPTRMHCLIEDDGCSGVATADLRTQRPR